MASDASARVFELAWVDDRIEQRELPNLPMPASQLCGARVADQVIVCGGIATVNATQALRQAWRLDLNALELGWRQLPPLPVERTQAVAGAWQNELFVFGGIRLRDRGDGQPEPVRPGLRDAWRWRVTHDDLGPWQAAAPLPSPLVGAPSPALNLGQTHLVIFGGAAGTRRDIDGATEPGFPGRVWAYQPFTDRWQFSRPLKAPVPRIAAPLVSLSADAAQPIAVVVGGPIRPGVPTGQFTELRVELEASRFTWLSWSILAGYLAAMVGIGAYCSRREHAPADFFLASRRIPWWASGLSIFATMLSAITYLGIPARSFGTNWTFFLLNCGILAVVPIVVTWYVPRFREVGITSAYEYLEARFSLGIRLLGSSSFIAFQLGRMGIVVLLPALALSAVTGANVYLSILVMGCLSTLYTVLGGIEAVIWTDVVQSLVLLGGALLAVAIMLLSIEGGLGSVLAEARAAHKLQWVEWNWDMLGTGLPVIVLAACFNNLISYTTDQAVIQRYLSTPDRAQAVRAVWANGWISVPASALFFFVGTCLFVFYQAFPERLPPLAKADQIFAGFIAHEMPSALAGLVIAGVFAAAMSSLDSSIHSVATAISTDFVLRFRPQLAPARLLRLARGLTLLLGIAGTATALGMATLDVPYLWKLFLDWVGLLGGPLAGLFALGIFTRRVQASHAWCGVMASVTALICTKFAWPVNGLLYGAIGTSSCIAASLLARYLRPDARR